VILLQVDSVELRGHEVTFQGYFQGHNADQYRGPNIPSQGGLGHYWYLSRSCLFSK
jgi:hypothetical protein